MASSLNLGARASSALEQVVARVKDLTSRVIPSREPEAPEPDWEQNYAPDDARPKGVPPHSSPEISPN